MFGISFMEIAVILIIAFFFFKPSEVLSFLGKFISFIENLKAKLEDIKNETFMETLEKEENLKDITPFEKTEGPEFPTSNEKHQKEN